MVQSYVSVSYSLFTYNLSIVYLAGVMKAGACKVAGVLKELAAFQRFERYPRVLGMD